MAESLKAGDAHVWYLWPDRVTDPERLKTHERTLSDDERTRIASFHRERDRHSRLLARAFVRSLLERYTGRAAADWEFVKDRFGKPDISGAYRTPINFSVSHTVGLIVCLFALDTAVGIDAENLQQPVDPLEIAHTFFSPVEYSVLRELAGTDRHRRFFEYWTLKEAYVKALGLGMSMNFAAFTFHIEDQGPRISFAENSPENPAAWEFRLFKPSDEHTVAAAIRTGSVNVDVRDGTSLMV